jgi:hypothetical protein
MRCHKFKLIIFGRALQSWFPVLDAGNICLHAFTQAKKNDAIPLTSATRTEDHLPDLLDFLISESVKIGKFIAFGTGGFPRSGKGRDSTRRRRR